MKALCECEQQLQAKKGFQCLGLTGSDENEKEEPLL